MSNDQENTPVAQGAEIRLVGEIKYPLPDSEQAKGEDQCQPHEYVFSGHVNTCRVCGRVAWDIIHSSPPPSGTDTPDTDSAMFCIGCGADGNGTPQDVVDVALSRHLESQRNHWRGLCGLKDEEIQRLTAERDQLRRERDDMEKLAELKEAGKEANRTEANGLRMKLAQVQKQLVDADENTSRLAQELEEVREELAELQRENTELIAAAELSHADFTKVSEQRNKYQETCERLWDKEALHTESDGMMGQEIQSLRQRVSDLEKDKARLDWLERSEYPWSFYKAERGWIGANCAGGEYKSLRSVLDAAMPSAPA